MKVLDLGVSPTILCDSETTALLWLQWHIKDEAERDFMRAQWKWIQVIEISDVVEMTDPKK